MLFVTPAICLCFHSSRYFTAVALGDSSVTVEDVTPRIFPSGPLFPSEERIVELFERNTYSVVNIFDVTLRPQLNVTGVVEVPEGNGSGVVWDNDGHIVTNYHVVGNALSRNPSPGQVVARVNILASDGYKMTDMPCKLHMVEASADLLKPVKVGQSSALKVGQQCLAIGNPFGFDHTLTVGVISGLDRDIFSQTGVTIGGGIQTDAAINPGNRSTFFMSDTIFRQNLILFVIDRVTDLYHHGTSAGVGFAIPSSTVLKIVPQLIQFGKVMGNSVAAKAGLLPTTRGFAGNIILGDVIVAVDDKPIRSKADLSKILDDYNVGDKVVLKGSAMNATVKTIATVQTSDDTNLHNIVSL
ncbi:Protease Do-like 8, chloroplastic [Cocos nucifera]|uniref:Protease Do-like 8, chloroplastic n=1 Tax=Cocos nucifera TaxID=13894 RepID=A0A8K0N280_COCNU|nr:Protease Do-like 8, chloroplastic [Cocos nucifera]